MLSFLLVFSLHGGAPAADPWFSADKLKHFFGAAFVQSASYSALRAAGVSHGISLGGASAVTVGASLGKEWWDARGHGNASARDLVWDGAGAASASLLLARTRR